MFIDTHCHLNSSQFNSNINLIVKRAIDADVTSLVIPSIDLESSQRAISLSNNNPHLFALIGIHPEIINAKFSHNLDEIDTLINQIEALLPNAKVKGIGEIGLDFHYLTTYPEKLKLFIKELQIFMFEQELKLASKYSLPVSVHSRSVDNLAIKIIKKHQLSQNLKGVFHCFDGDINLLQQALETGFFISFTGNITYSQRLDEVIKATPLDRILIETDSPYLAPIPFRGQTNFPEYVKIVAQKLADIKKLDLHEIANLTSQNADQLFNLN